MTAYLKVVIEVYIGKWFKSFNSKVRFEIIFLVYHANAYNIKFYITEIVGIPKNKSYLNVSFSKISIYFIFTADLKSYLCFQLSVKSFPIKHFCIHMTMNARAFFIHKFSTNKRHIITFLSQSFRVIWSNQKQSNF